MENHITRRLYKNWLPFLLLIVVLVLPALACDLGKEEPAMGARESQGIHG